MASAPMSELLVDAVIIVLCKQQIHAQLANTMHGFRNAGWKVEEHGHLLS